MTAHPHHPHPGRRVVLGVALSMLPGAFHWLPALPNGLAMICLGCSLGRTTRTDGGSAGAAASDLRPYVAMAGAA